jgi:hypothetical protein
VMIEGGPCSSCGTTNASIWYGKKDGPKYCKKAGCMRQGGYLMPKKVKAGSAAAKRARAPVKEEEEEEVINLDTTITELVDIYGQRCALPAPAASLSPARAPAHSFVHRYCDPSHMEKHELRNELPPACVSATSTCSCTASSLATRATRATTPRRAGCRSTTC